MSDTAPALDTLLLAERTPPRSGGRESMLEGLLRHLPGDSTLLVAPGLPGAGAFDRSVSVKVKRRPTPCPAPLVPFLRRKHFEWHAKRWNPRIVVAFGLRVEAPLALAHKRRSGTPFVLHLDAPELVEAQKELRAGSERGRRIQEILDECEAIVTTTEACRLEAYRTGVLPHHLQVIPIGVDLQRFRPGERSAALASGLRVGRGAVLVTVVSGGRSFDLATVFRAFASIRAQIRGSALVVVGAADARQWKRELERLRVDRAVRFTGRVDPEAMPDHYRLADVYLSAHKEDRETGAVQGPGVSLVEALACGIPVVTTRTPVTEDLAPEGEGGVLAEPEAHAKLARAAGDILRSPERRAALAQAARERAESVHDVRETTGALREFLEVVYYRRLRRGNLAPAEPAEAEGSARPAA